MKFKGTKGQHKKLYQGDICIGIGVETSLNYFEMTAHSILPDCEDMSDNEVDKYMSTLEADMTLYSKAPELLTQLQSLTDMVVRKCSIGNDPNLSDLFTEVQKSVQLINSATTI